MNYRINSISTTKEIKKIIGIFDNYFVPKLTETIEDIDEYAEKVLKNASSYELINDQKDVFGALVFYCNDKTNYKGYISLIMIDRKNQNKGFGKELLDFCENECKNNGMRYLNLEVYKNNTAAISFYKKNGYKVFEELSNSYYMTKKLV